MAFCRETADGLEVSVRATPKGGRDALDGVSQLSDGRDVLKIRVRAAPEDGAATAAVAKVLAGAAGVAPSAVRLASGATARLKVFRISGDAARLRVTLEAAVAAL
ncbi:hypothetical protein DFO45_3157 [Azorhizobium sp. AG788]|uniref:DUF167 family protein n=1 Tax=Azorhizobium sp. AG788 TaxID=2183897 RepID=UPI00106095C5|nr:DUF167 family protein [Azorhizobium sp. AG788]TDT93773.1 hypothetical protein DFO45_3157 [Azorhizobium sp. AG788]